MRITAAPGSTFIDRMIKLVEGAERQKTPNEIALNILLVGLTIIFVFATATIPSYVAYAGGAVSVVILVALFVTLIPTTIGALLSAIGIAGMDRLVRFNVLAMSGRAVEAAGDVDTLLLDKTGTITLGNRQATEFKPLRGVTEQELADAAQLASLADETPEGRSIVVLAKEKYGIRGRDLAEMRANFIPFTAQSRMSGVEVGGSWVRKGAVDAILNFLNAPPVTVGADRCGALQPAVSAEAAREINAIADAIAKSGGTPLAVAKDGRLLGVIHLKDIVKGGIRERFAELRRMGIRTVMITGDNPMTAAAIAAEAGVDDFLAQATPEDKLRLIRDEQAKGKLVAMCGDGTNDAPALAQADVGVAMNTGTQAAREAGNMVDLDSNPTKLIEIVEIGKQLLMTRGALTTFSIANDVAKYFAIIPAMFLAFYPQLQALNIMKLASPAERDPVGDHLQCADHHRAHSAGAEGRALSPDRRRSAAAAQPADLRRRRHHHSVRRHQGHRPRWSRPCISLEEKHHVERNPPGDRVPRRPHPHHRARLSAGDHRHRRRCIFPHQAQGSLIEQDGKVVGSAADRPGVRRRQIFPRPAVRHQHARPEGSDQERGRALQRGQFRRLEPRPDQQGAGRSRARAMSTSSRPRTPRRRSRSTW